MCQGTGTENSLRKWVQGGLTKKAALELRLASSRGVSGVIPWGGLPRQTAQRLKGLRQWAWLIGGAEKGPVWPQVGEVGSSA